MAVVRLVVAALLVVIMVGISAAPAVAQGTGGAMRAGRARVGKLQVVVSVAGAEIAVDGTPVAIAPMGSPVQLTVGTHALKVSKPGHAEYLDTVKIAAGETTTVEVDLLPFAAVLQIRTTPPGADVYVDGTLVGQSPVDVDGDPGTRQVRVSLDGYHDGQTALQVAAGETYQVALQLVALPPPPKPVVPKRPIYKEWWFWAATGAVAVGATAIIIGASGDGDPLGGVDRVIDVKF